MAKQQEQKLTFTESYQDQLCKLYSFQEEKARYRKSYLEWDKIDRANKKINPIRQKSFFLSGPANRLLSIIVAKLKRGERVLLNHKYISTFTFVERRQNVRIIEELEDILDITYHNSITIDGKKYRHSYEFAHKEQAVIGIPITLEQKNTASVENSVATFMSQQNDFLHIYKENNNIEDIDHESNSSFISKEVKIEENTTSEIVLFPKEPVKTVKLKKRLLNKRKKPTNAEKKAKVYKPFAYAKPKTLTEMLPLIDRVTCDELRSKSGRPFSDNFIIQLILKMSKDPAITATFDYKSGFIAYMAKALHYEKHDAIKTGNINFRFKANIPENSNEHQEQQRPLELLKLPEGIWGDICQKLIIIYDEYVYKNWFSNLVPIIDEKARTIELKAPNSFVKQWIETNYRDMIKEIAKSLGLELKEITYMLLPKERAVFSCGTTWEEVIPNLTEKTTTNGFQSLSVFRVVDKLQIID
jgi:hypothetical protein